jgi:hypothetical protein
MSVLDCQLMTPLIYTSVELSRPLEVLMSTLPLLAPESQLPPLDYMECFVALEAIWTQRLPASEFRYMECFDALVANFWKNYGTGPEFSGWTFAEFSRTTFAEFLRTNALDFTKDWCSPETREEGWIILERICAESAYVWDGFELSSFGWNEWWESRSGRFMDSSESWSGRDIFIELDEYWLETRRLPCMIWFGAKTEGSRCNRGELCPYRHDWPKSLRVRVLDRIVEYPFNPAIFRYSIEQIREGNRKFNNLLDNRGV